MLTSCFGFGSGTANRTKKSVKTHIAPQIAEGLRVISQEIIHFPADFLGPTNRGRKQSGEPGQSNDRSDNNDPRDHRTAPRICSVPALTVTTTANVFTVARILPVEDSRIRTFMRPPSIRNEMKSTDNILNNLVISCLIGRCLYQGSFTFSCCQAGRARHALLGSSDKQEMCR